jgi:hypothetical protein
MKTNALKFTDSRTAKNGEQWVITIRLDDECKNGHQDFSITGTCWEAGKPRTDKYMICGGACGDEISVLFPEYEIFNRLHLCDYKGIPMHCSANGYYHLNKGFHSKSTGGSFEKEYCDYYRISRAQFQVLRQAESETHFAMLLESERIFEQWEAEAKIAIKKLEKLTGDKFVVDSVRTQYHRPSDEKIAEETERIKNGYYSADSKRARALEAERKKLQEIDEKEEAEIQKIRLEYKIKRILFGAGEKAYENYIFYNHSNTIKFNWRNYGDKMSAEEILDIKNKLDGLLPEGVTFA